MHLHWTFTDEHGKWIYDTYPTKEEAIKIGSVNFEGSFLVGQLIGDDWSEDLTYMIENIEEVN